MPRAVQLQEGDGLTLDDGSIVRVEAASEALIEIRADALRTLVRIAWHLGNRHLPTQLLGSMNPPRLRIRHDHVIADMVEGLRSEEHTSELQSLMRISYAVFCLKKKTTIYSETKHQHTHEPTA